MSGELVDDLVAQINSRRVVVVVGAGVSIAASANAPSASWIGLLRHGVQRISDLNLAPSEKWRQRQLAILEEAATPVGDLGDLLSVAEQVATKLGVPSGGEWKRWLREAVGELKISDRGVLEAIAALRVPIATTNYDDFLAHSTGTHPVAWTDAHRATRVLRGEEQGVLHLHGHWRTPESVILSVRSYDQLLHQDFAQHLQRIVPTLNSLLFIGCGATLEDPNFLALRTWMRANLRTAEHRHFRLARKGEVAADEHDADERIFVVEYGAKHADLEPFLRALGKRISAPPSQSGASAPARTPTAEIDANQYGQRARKKWEAVDVTSLARPGAIDEDERIRLADVFIAPNARRARPAVSLPRDYLEGQKIEPAQEERLQEEIARRWEQAERRPVLDFLGAADLRYLFVLGDPGAGKSTLMRYLLLQLLEPVPANAPEWRRTLQDHLPFLIELRDYIARENEGRCTSLLGYLDYLGAEQGFGFNARSLAARFAEGRAILILDGLDEIFDPAKRARIVEEIIGLQSNYPALRLIGTSRITGFNAKPLEDAQFTVVTLDDLTQDQIETFAKVWFTLAFPGDAKQAERSSSELIDAVRARPQLKAIAGNPLILTIMAIVARHEPLERSRSGVYDQALTALCHTLDFKRKALAVADDSALRGLGPSDKLALLRHVASAMQEGDGLRANAISAERLSATIRAFLEDFGLDRISARRATDEMTRVLQERNWILTVRGPDLYGFVHRTFLEHLCAANFLQRIRSQELTIDALIDRQVKPNLKDDSWHEVIRLLTGQLARDNPAHAGRVIAALVEKRGLIGPDRDQVALACECLAELETKQLGAITSDIAAVVEALNEEIRRGLDLLGLLTWYRSETRITTALAHVRVPDSVRASLGLRQFPHIESYQRPKWFLHISIRIPAPLVPAVVDAFWEKDDVTRQYLRRTVETHRETFIHQDAMNTLEKCFGAHPETRTWIADWAVGHATSGTRTHALSVLARQYTKHADTLALLRRRILDDPDAGTRGSAAAILAQYFGDDPDTPRLIRERVLADPDAKARGAIVDVLGQSFPGDPGTRTLVFARAIEDPGPEARTSALRVLIRRFKNDVETKIFIRERAIADADPAVRADALGLLAQEFNEDPDTHSFVRSRVVDEVDAKGRAKAQGLLWQHYKTAPETLALIRARTAEDADEATRAVARKILDEHEGAKKG